MNPQFGKYVSKCKLEHVTLFNPTLKMAKPVSLEGRCWASATVVALDMRPFIWHWTETLPKVVGGLDHQL